MELLLENLKTHVTCSICLDIYTKSKTIACLPTFCSECQERQRFEGFFEKQLDQAFEFSKNLVERGSSSDIMQNKKNLEERIARQDHNASSSGKLVCRICVDMWTREFVSGIYEIQGNRCARIDRGRTGSEFPSWCRKIVVTILSQNKRRRDQKHSAHRSCENTLVLLIRWGVWRGVMNKMNFS